MTGGNISKKVEKDITHKVEKKHPAIPTDVKEVGSTS